MPGHIDRRYHAQLEELSARLQAMHGAVTAMLCDALRALEAGDLELAEQVRAADRAVNAEELALDQLILRLLALRQPMAGDLRLLMGGSRMVTDLERIGDIAVSIARRVRRLARPLPPEVRVLFGKLEGIVLGMLAESGRAFGERDTERARGVLCRDEEADAATMELLRALVLRLHAGVDGAEASMAMQTAASHLERIGDHATNLAEQVIFLVHGRDVRHQPLLPAGD